MNPPAPARVPAVMRLTRLIALVPVLALLGCEVPAGLNKVGGNELVETHQAIVEGVVLGALDTPLRDVDIILRFAGSRQPAPTTRTDASGRFLLVLAIYNGSGPADSAAATVYAFAQPPFYSTSAADHVDILVRFLERSQEPPRTSVVLRLAELPP